MGHGSGWWSYISYDEQQDRPQVSRSLLLRVARTARPYWGPALAMLGLILLISLIGLIPPLLIRDFIDRALPQKDVTRLNWLALGMIAVPLFSGLLGVGQRYLGARIGEQLIADLRQALYAHMQRMSLRFFTHTKTGELMSRLNNDVVDSQRAVTGTFIDIITNLVTLVTTLAIMLSLEWRLTLLSIIIFPLFVLPARRVGRVLRQIVREALDKNAAMNALMSETLNVSGALLTKLFGRQADEVAKFTQRSDDVARHRHPPGVGGALVLPDPGPGQRGRHGAGLLGRRPPGHQRRLHRGHDRRLHQLPDPALRPDRLAEQHPCRFCPVAGQFRARVRGVGPAGGDPGRAGCGRSRPGARARPV